MNDEMIRRDEVEALLERRLAQFKRRVALTAAGLLAVGFGVSAGHAWAVGSCAQTLPAPLVTLCPGSPALASELNGNTETLRTWLTQKVGPQGTADVTVTGTTSLRLTALNDQPLYLRHTGDATHRLAYTGTGFGGATFDGPLLTGYSGGALATMQGGNAAVVWSNTGAALNGAVNINGTGGNVPHACTIRTAANTTTVACQGSELAVGGGGSCPTNIAYNLYESYPTANGWYARCKVWGDANAPANPATVYAVCCAR